MKHSFDEIEALAKRICEANGGEWSRKGTKKNHWRKLASKRLEVNYGLADTFMAIFGFRRKQRD